MQISIIIPVYNSEKYIERNYNSICQQDFKDFEVIYVNDGSKDFSLNKLKEIRNNHKDHFNIKIIDKENGGVSSARNAGMDVAEGEYLCFIDVDDEIMPEYLSYMYGLSKKHNVNLVFCSTHQDKNFIQKEKDIKEKLYSKEQALKSFLYRKIATGACSILCKNEVFKVNNLRFAEGYKYSEDIHMIWRLFNVNSYVVGTTKKLYIYYHNPGSAMAIFNDDKLHSIKLMQQLESYFDNTNPKFSTLFKKYGVARMYWSVLWQCAIKTDKNYFFQFCKENKAKGKFKRLISFRSIKVSLSSIIGLLSLKLFRFLAIRFGKHLTH